MAPKIKTGLRETGPLILLTGLLLTLFAKERLPDPVYKGIVFVTGIGTGITVAYTKV